MMDRIWLQIFAVLTVGVILKLQVHDSLMMIGIDVIELGVIYYILRRSSIINVKYTMSFLGVLTLIDILADVGWITSTVANVIILLLLLWLIFGGGQDTMRPQVKKLRHKWHK